MADYRQAGGRVGSYIRNDNPSTQQIQALLSDLLAGDELLSTMRDVVCSSYFQALYPLAGSGKGSIQRDALLRELARRYLPEVVDEVGQLINGMLDLPASRTSHGQTSTKGAEEPDSNNGQGKHQTRKLTNRPELCTREQDSARRPGNYDAPHNKKRPSQSLGRRNRESHLKAQSGAKSAQWQLTLTGIGIYAVSLIFRFIEASNQIEKNDAYIEGALSNTTDCGSVLKQLLAADPEEKLQIYSQHRWQCTGDAIKTAAGIVN